jgi:hypothetical protein
MHVRGLRRVVGRRRGGRLHARAGTRRGRRACGELLIVLVTIGGITCVDLHGITALQNGDLMTWEIRTSLGRHARAGVDGSGWLWEISRGDQVACVMIEISGAAWSANPLGLPEDTRRALETDGRTELLKVLGHDDPPAIIRCDTTGCAYLSAGQ